MGKRPATARRRAHLFGLRAEAIAAILMRLKGYRVLARRFVVSGGEIDIVAQRGQTIAFVEVKARDTYDAAAEAIQPHQQTRIRNAALAFLARRPDLAGLSLRFDVVLVTPRALPRHLCDAWRDSA